jgi:2-phosphosulfolactate phosphatase
MGPPVVAMPVRFHGALVNAQAVAAVVSSLLEQKALSVTVIACGERWKTPSEDGALRVALEDYLGAGAILSYLPQEKSPEARVCAGAFVQVRDDLHTLLWECGSGRELREKGFGGGCPARCTLHAARLNAYETVPHMRDRHFEPFDLTTVTNEKGGQV